MKYFNNFIGKLEYSFSRKNFFTDFFLRRYFVLFSSCLLGILFFLFIHNTWFSKNEALYSVISNDLKVIEKILCEIEKECNIFGVRTTSDATIDFFTVDRFIGSTVGFLNLAHPEKWAGPFLKQNPTVQGICYELVKTKDGVYIVPGKGVRLPNNMIIGKDVHITATTVMSELLQSGGLLMYKNKPCAIKISFTIDHWDGPQITQTKAKQVNKVLKEFADALPYAQIDKSTNRQDQNRYFV